MPTHQQHTETGTYFVTFTCYKWLPLFELTDLYSSVYNWFNIIQAKGVQLVGFVIMPNHVHCLVHINNSKLNLNKLVGNGKRFMAYEIVEKLVAINDNALLSVLAKGVQLKERKKGKKHQVFRLSFDAKLCFTETMLEQKLAYIHANPVSGKWNLAADFTHYKHSSAAFYEKDVLGRVKLTHYKDIKV